MALTDNWLYLMAFMPGIYRRLINLDQWFLTFYKILRNTAVKYNSNYIHFLIFFLLF